MDSQPASQPERHKDTVRLIDRQTDRQRHTDTERARQTERHKDTVSLIDIQTDRERETERHRKPEPDRQVASKTDRQRNIQTERD